MQVFATKPVNRERMFSQHNLARFGRILIGYIHINSVVLGGNLL
jgi:hypothetical protein